MAEILLGNIKGPKGDKGEKGDTGQGFKVLDYYATLEELSSAITNPSAGDAYGVGSDIPYDIYIYSPSNGWVNNGPLQGAKGDTGEQGPQGEQGEKGDAGTDGKNATITGLYATVDSTIGTPRVTVSTGGTETEKTFSFAFSGIKGEQGERGEKGEKGDVGECTVDQTYNSESENAQSGKALEPKFNGIWSVLNQHTSEMTTKADKSTTLAGYGITDAFTKDEISSLMVNMVDVDSIPTINDQTPTYTEATTLTALTSGEKMSVAFGKIKKAVTDLISHLADTTKHITSTERTTWNGKAPASHASTATTYGVGTSSNYGHLKITDSTTSTATDTAASAKAIKSVADTLSSLQTSVASLQNSGNIKIVKGSYVGTGTYVMAKSSDSVMAQKANKIVCPGFPIYVAIKRSPEDFPTVIMPNPETREADFKSYGGNDYSGGLCSCYVKSDNTLIWYTSGNRWHYKANSSTGEVSIAIPTLTDTEKANLGPINQLNWEGETYDYIAICDSSIT